MTDASSGRRYKYIYHLQERAPDLVADVGVPDSRNREAPSPCSFGRTSGTDDLKTDPPWFGSHDQTMAAQLY